MSLDKTSIHTNRPAETLDSFDSKAGMRYQKCLKLAEIFSPERLGIKDGVESPVLNVWSKEKSRAIYFSLYDCPSIKELATCLDMPEPTIRTHLVDLERRGLVRRISERLPSRYQVSLAPLIELLGSEHNAIHAMKDHFSSFNSFFTALEQPVRNALHETLMTVSSALQNPERVRLYRNMKNAGVPLRMADIQAIMSADSEQAGCHAIRTLLKAELVEATDETRLKYTQREYKAVVSPFITIINDFNDEFGEGKVIDISDKRKFFDVTRNSSLSEHNRFYNSAAAVFQALRKEEYMDTLRWFQRRAEPRSASQRAGVFGDSGASSEYIRIRKLKEAGLLVVSYKEGPSEYLKVDWRPLQKVIYGLIS